MSNIEWYGKIPVGWKHCRLKNIISEKKYAIVDGPFGSAISTSDYREDGVPLVRITNLKQGNVSNEDLVYIEESLAEKVQRSKFSLGDIIFAKTGATIGKCALNSSIESGILASSCVKVSLSEHVNKKYFYYLFSSEGFNSQIRYVCGGTTRDTINLTPFSNLEIVLPPTTEQNKIAEKLDERVKYIDDLIENEADQIDKLLDYKKKKIIKVVNEGIGNNDLISSDVDYILPYKKNWKLLRGKNILKLLDRPVLEDDSVITCFRDGEVTLRSKRREEGFTFADKEIGYQGIEAGDLVIHGMDGFAGAIGISTDRGKGSPVLSVCDSSENKRFIVYYLRSLAYRDVILALSTGIRVRSCDLRWNKVANLLYPVPPRAEQDNIVSFLDRVCDNIDKMIEVKTSKIEKLNEYKKSLIYEYVTGKRQVA